jgi:hypothetical protein
MNDIAYIANRHADGLFDICDTLPDDAHTAIRLAIYLAAQSAQQSAQLREPETDAERRLHLWETTLFDWLETWAPDLLNRVGPSFDAVDAVVEFAERQSEMELALRKELAQKEEELAIYRVGCADLPTLELEP